MKNIGIISHNFPSNIHDRKNAGAFVNDIAQELSKYTKVSVYCPSDVKRFKKIGKVQIINFPVFRGKRLGNLRLWNIFDVANFIIFFIGGILFLNRFIKRNSIQVNICMWAFPSGVFAYLSKKIYGIPYVVWCLGSDIYIYAKIPVIKKIVKLILNNADFIFADGVDLSRETQNLSEKECIFLPSATRSRFKKQKIIRDKHIVITMVARLEYVKGPDILIDAFFQLKNKDDFRINIIGDGSMMRVLKQKAKLFITNKKIVFHGNINDFQTISKIIRGSDWLIIPSRSDSIPLVFSETMKCQVPVLASDLPDLTYLIKRYKVGYLFQKENVQKLSQLISKLPKKEIERKMFSINTKKAAEDFSVEESVKKLINYLLKT